MGSTMTDRSDLERKPSRESEIDYLLAEEFECDPIFAARFAAACGLGFATLKVVRAVLVSCFIIYWPNVLFCDSLRPGSPIWRQ